jgi:hypothetical protein
MVVVMSTQPEALQWADKFEKVHGKTYPPISVLRRLHDVELHLAQVERGFDKLLTERDALHLANAELLEALKSILEDMDSEHGTDYDYAKARAAIAKATGVTK